jgi:hypothetical protein
MNHKEHEVINTFVLFVVHRVLRAPSIFDFLFIYAISPAICSIRIDHIRIGITVIAVRRIGPWLGICRY